jgi:hypothetical protein
MNLFWRQRIVPAIRAAITARTTITAGVTAGVHMIAVQFPKFGSRA